jgi:hypothetical protein
MARFGLDETTDPVIHGTAAHKSGDCHIFLHAFEMRQAEFDHSERRARPVSRRFRRRWNASRKAFSISKIKKSAKPMPKISAPWTKEPAPEIWTPSRTDDETKETKSLGGLQGQSCFGGAQGRQDVG